VYLTGPFHFLLSRCLPKDGLQRLPSTTAGNMPAFTFRQMVARDQPVASITAGKRRNFLVVLINIPGC
jgi:hypothetical protein